MRGELAFLACIALAGCATAPPRAITTAGYEIRTHQALDDECHRFGRELGEIDARLRAIYGVELPSGVVWVDPDAFRGQPIGGTYEWFSDRIVLADPDFDYLAHELVHRYNRYAFGELPRWLDEGIAYSLARGCAEALAQERCPAGLESPARRRPDFEAIAEVREARAASLREVPLDAEGAPPQPFPSLAEVFENPYDNGHLNVRIATAIVDRLLREVVRTARDLTPEGARAVLERACFQDFPREDELRALLASDGASDELVISLVGPSPDLEALVRAAAPDPLARRRLALLLSQIHTLQGPGAERRWLDKLLQDQDPRVARAAVFSLGAHDDRRMIGPGIEVLKDAPLFRYVKLQPGGGARFETVPLERMLLKLAGECPPGARTEGLDDTEPVPYRVIEAWEKWYAQHLPPASERVVVPALARVR